MRIFNGIALCSLLGFSEAWAYTNLGNNSFQSDGSASDTQAAVYAATTGGLVRIPPGSYKWTKPGVLTNGVNLTGSGSGYIAGDSATSIAIGTGTKVFTTRLSTFNLTNNQNITAYFIADGSNYRMVGTVTSFSGTTLTLNVTSTVGSGTKAAWVFVAPATTTITNAASAPTL